MAQKQDNLFHQAETQRAQRNYEGAIQTYQKILEQDPHNEDAHYKLAEIFVIRGLVPQVISQYLKLAQVLEEKGEYDGALEVSQWVVKLDPPNTVARLKMIEIFKKRGQQNLVINQSLLLSKIYSMLGQGDQALVTLQELQSLCPDNLDLSLQIGEMNIRQGQISEGLAMYKKIAGEFLSRKDLQRGLDAHKRIKAIRPDDMHNLLTLAEIYEELGMLDEAKGELRLILRQDLSHVKSLEHLGLIAKAQGKLEEALLPFRKIAEIDPTNALAREQLGELSEALGDMVAAVRSYIASGELYEKEGKTEKCIEIYQNILALDPEHGLAKRKLEGFGAEVVPRRRVAEGALPARLRAKGTERPPSMEEVTEEPAVQRGTGPGLPEAEVSEEAPPLPEAPEPYVTPASPHEVPAPVMQSPLMEEPGVVHAIYVEEPREEEAAADEGEALPETARVDAPHLSREPVTPSEKQAPAREAPEEVSSAPGFLRGGLVAKGMMRPGTKSGLGKGKGREERKTFLKGGAGQPGGVKWTSLRGSKPVWTGPERKGEAPPPPEKKKEPTYATGSYMISPPPSVADELKPLPGAMTGKEPEITMPIPPPVEAVKPAEEALPTPVEYQELPAEEKVEAVPALLYGEEQKVEIAPSPVYGEEEATEEAPVLQEVAEVQSIHPVPATRLDAEELVPEGVKPEVIPASLTLPEGLKIEVPPLPEEAIKEEAPSLPVETPSPVAETVPSVVEAPAPVAEALSPEAKEPSPEAEQPMLPEAPSVRPEVMIALAQVGELMSAGKTGEALKICQGIAGAAPEDLLVKRLLSSLYYQSGMLQEAMEHFHSLLQVNSGDLEVRQWLLASDELLEFEEEASLECKTLARFFLARGEKQNALEYLLRALTIQQKDLEARSLLVTIYREEGDHLAALHHSQILTRHLEEEHRVQELIEVYQEVLKIKPQDCNIRFRLALAYQELGKMSEAMASFRMLADAYERAGEVNQAIESLKRVRELAPQDVLVLRKLGLLYGKAGDQEKSSEMELEIARALMQANLLDEALEAYREVVRQRPHFLPAMEELVRGYLKKGMIREATADSRKLAELYIQDGKTEKAAALYTTLIKMEPEDIALRQQLCEFYVKGGMVSSALKELLALSQIYTSRGLFNEAAEACKQALNLDPDSVDARYHLGLLLADHLGNQEGALRELEKVRQQNPKHAAALQRLAKGYSRLQNVERAMDMVRELMTVDPASAKLLEDMVGDYRAETQRKPEDMVAKYNLGLIYKELGQLDLAIEQFQIVVRRSQEKVVQAHSALGLCFKEKAVKEGNPSFLGIAVKQFEKGIGLKGHREEEYIELHYNLARLFEENLGDIKEAITKYMDVKAIDLHYKDVDQRLERLEQEAKSPKVTRLPQKKIDQIS